MGFDIAKYMIHEQIWVVQEFKVTYSQTKWSVPLTIELMNWLFEYITRLSFYECNSVLIIGKRNPQEYG